MPEKRKKIKTTKISKKAKKTYSRDQLEKKDVCKLRDIARKKGLYLTTKVPGKKDKNGCSIYRAKTKKELIKDILTEQNEITVKKQS